MKLCSISAAFLPLILLIFSCDKNIDNKADTCSNRLLDPGETCIDCGGDCPPCTILSGRYVDPVFSEYNRIGFIKYSEGKMLPLETERDLYCVLYEPNQDSAAYRPMIILIGQTTYAMDPDGTYFTLGIDYLGDFLEKGYVVVNLSSIRFWIGEYPIPVNSFIETAFQISGDCLAAVDFFTRYSELYRIDTANIYLMGASMGAMAALHAAYIHDEDLNHLDEEWVQYIQDERESRAEPYQGSVKGVINLAGMILDEKMIDEGEPRLLSIIGKNDDKRPYECTSIQVDWIDSGIDFCGPKAMMSRMSSVGQKLGDNQLKLIEIDPADDNAPFDPNQCPECPELITNFISSRLSYCTD